MKLLPPLPRALELLFTCLRYFSVAPALIWIVILTAGVWVNRHYAPDASVRFSVGTVALEAPAVALTAVPAGAGASGLELTQLRGSLELQVLAVSPGLLTRVRWSLGVALAAWAAFAWLVFGALARVCANIQGGHVFTEANFRLLRRAGLLLFGYSCASLLIAAVADYAIGRELGGHYQAVGLEGVARLPASIGGLSYSLPSLWMGNPGGLVVGLVVLLVAEVFRRGLALQAENDMTI